MRDLRSPRGFFQSTNRCPGFFGWCEASRQRHRRRSDPGCSPPRPDATAGNPGAAHRGCLPPHGPAFLMPFKTKPGPVPILLSFLEPGGAISLKPLFRGRGSRIVSPPLPRPLRKRGWGTALPALVKRVDHGVLEFSVEQSRRTTSTATHPQATVARGATILRQCVRGDASQASVRIDTIGQPRIANMKTGPGLVLKGIRVMVSSRFLVEKPTTPLPSTPLARADGPTTATGPRRQHRSAAGAGPC